MKRSKDNLKPIRILIIEDNPADVELVMESVHEAKILADVTVAEDGEKALTLFKTERPDLILLDLSLPKISGREVLQFIKNHPILSAVPVIILSGSAAEVDIARSYKMGANSYIVKPVDADQFLDVITSFGHFWLDIVELPSPELLKVHERDLKTPVPIENTPEAPQITLPSPLNILLIDDSEPDTELVRLMLEESPSKDFRLTPAPTLDAGLQLLKTQSFEALLLDLSLPDSPPRQTLRTVLDQFSDIPILVVTSQMDLASATQAVRDGAQDYFVKGEFEADVLKRAIHYAIERKQIEKDRTAALVAAIHSKQEAEKAIWSREDFISIASHELRTPLTSLMLQTKMLINRLEVKEETPPLPQMKKLLRTYDREVERLKTLVNNLLDVTRIESGSLGLTEGPCDLTALANGVVRDLEALLAEARCPVSIETPPELIGNWDCFRLQQLLTNLVVNAMKYAKGKPIRIEISREGETVLLKVIDHGPGISEQDVPKLFRRFERIGERGGTGFGLGLYISRQIVDAHGGTIGVESRIGQGTVFTVKLPIRERLRAMA